MLFDAILEKPWINPGDVIYDWAYSQTVIAGLLTVAQGVGDTATTKLLAMPFLRNADYGDERRLDILAEMAELGESDFHLFLDTMNLSGGIITGIDPEDYYYLYVSAVDEQATGRIDGRSWRGNVSPFVVSSMSKLFVRHNEVFRAFADNYTNKYAWPGATVDVLEVAGIDEGLATRMASMPVSAEFAGNTHVAWFFLMHAATKDPGAAGEVLGRFEEQGGVDYTNLPNFIVDIVGVIDPNLSMAVNAFDWVRDGIDTPGSGINGGELRVNPSNEEHVVALLSWTPFREQEKIADMLIGKAWLQDSITADEWHALNVLLTQLSNEHIVRILDMQFLDSFEGADWSLIYNLNSFIRNYEWGEIDPVEELLQHRLIRGEFTDENQQYVSSAMEDVVQELV